VAPLPNPDTPEEPGVPHIQGRDLVPIRRNPGLERNIRLQRLFAEEDDLRDEIQHIDQQMLDLAARRQQLLYRVSRVHDEVRPVYHGCRGRRRRRVSGEPPLPPVAENPTLVIGRELRAICLVFLHQAGRALSLRSLHAQVHRAGYAVAHAHPAKALADAMGHEVDANRCTRMRRGIYALAHPPGEHGESLPDVALPDW
jgi:hypothetical protein